MVVNAEKTKPLKVLKDICTEERGINLDTLEKIILLAVELAREQRRLQSLFQRALLLGFLKTGKLPLSSCPNFGC